MEKKKDWVFSEPYIKQFKTNEELSSIFIKTACAFFNINITNKELEFLSFMMLREKGAIGQLGKKLYLEKYRIGSRYSLDNTISKLKKKKLIVKIDNKLRIHPKILINFIGDNYIFQFRCKCNKTGDTK